MGSSWGSPHPAAGSGGAALTAGGDVFRGLARAQGQSFLVVILRRGSGGQGRSRIHRYLGQKHPQREPGSSRSPSRAREGSQCPSLARGQPGTHRFGRLVPRQLQANAVTGVPLLVLHVLQVPQVTVCTGKTEGEGSRKAELDIPAVPCRDLHGPALGRSWEVPSLVFGFPQTATREQEQTPTVIMPTLDTGTQLSPFFQRSPGSCTHPVTPRASLQLSHTYRTPQRGTPRSWCHCPGTLC